MLSRGRVPAVSLPNRAVVGYGALPAGPRSPNLYLYEGHCSEAMAVFANLTLKT